MATSSSILVWKIPWTKEPGGLQSMGSQRVDWACTYVFVFKGRLPCNRLYQTSAVLTRLEIQWLLRTRGSSQDNSYLTLLSLSRKRIREECSKENVRYDTSIIRLIFKTNTLGAIYPNKRDALLKQSLSKATNILQQYCPRSIWLWNFSSSRTSRVKFWNKQGRLLLFYGHSLVEVSFGIWFLRSGLYLIHQIGLKWLLASIRKKGPSLLEDGG